MEIPRDHPRYESLRLRELIADGYENGLVDRTGLIAHGRGEAFDYLFGEITHPEAVKAARSAAAYLLTAKHPVISINGNTAVLVPDELIELSELVPLKMEVNIFHRTEERVTALVDFLNGHGARNVLGINPNSKIPTLSHARALCTKDGIFTADTVLVPLEDGDRAKALVGMKKNVIIIDLNPLSRSAKSGTVTIVDNLCRAIKVLINEVNDLINNCNRSELNEIIDAFDNDKNLHDMIKHFQLRL